MTDGRAARERNAQACGCSLERQRKTQHSERQERKWSGKRGAHTCSADECCLNLDEGGILQFISESLGF